VVGLVAALRWLRPGSIVRPLVIGCVPAMLLAGGYLLSDNYRESRGGPASIPSQAAAPSQAVGTRPPARLTGSPVPPALSGRLIYATEGRLWSLGLTGGEPIDLTPDRSRATMAAEPAISPDGTRLAFTLIALPTLDQGAGATAAPGSDIYLLHLRDGTRRRVLEHDRPSTLIDSLSWTRDGRALIYAHTSPILATDGRLTGVAREVHRLDLETGQIATLVADAHSPALSPDGTQLAYVASNPRTFETTLWLAGADGSTARQLVGTQGGFADFLAPRFSPDGTQIAFSAAGGPGVAPPSPSPANGGAGQVMRWLAALFAPAEVAAHGAQRDVWIVARDGSNLQRLTAFYEDEPIPAWSSDGRWVAILAGGGIYLARADGAALLRRSGTGGAGSLCWTELEVVPPPQP
jgi:Tol biopolymer transport system component